MVDSSLFGQGEDVDPFGPASARIVEGLADLNPGQHAGDVDVDTGVQCRHGSIRGILRIAQPQAAPAGILWLLLDDDCAGRRRRRAQQAEANEQGCRERVWGPHAFSPCFQLPRLIQRYLPWQGFRPWSRRC